MSKVKILITGASGFIGTNVLNFFKKDAEVINVDILPPRDSECSDVWVKADIRDGENLCKVFESFSPDYIIHLAARTDLDGGCLDDYDVNTVGVLNVLTAAQKCPNLKKILFTSSMLVCRSGYIPRGQKDYSPINWYGCSKVETERIVWENQPACDWAILRPTSVWGPWFGIPYRNFFEMIKHRTYFHIGYKSCTKTYGYIENVVYQIGRILVSDTVDMKEKVFYLGDITPVIIEEWADEIASCLGYRIHRMPYCFFKCAAIFGDVLQRIGYHFPMTSFRLKNMITDNIIPLDATYKIAPFPPVSRMEGIKRTLEWMKCIDEQ